MSQRAILLQEQTKKKAIRIKQLYKYPLPKSHEIKLILEHLPNFHPYKIALGLLIIQGMRPIELCRLTRECFILNDKYDIVLKIKHLVYKPRNNKSGVATYKEVEKPIYSKWLSNQLIGYFNLYPKYPYDRLFCFTTPDSLHKFFINLRKKHSDKFPFLLDKNSETIKGQDKTQYRINLYSFRRFSFTFHYWITYKMDAVAVSKIFGHSKVDTTLTHYIYPKDAINLTDKEINTKPNIDTFLKLISINGQLPTFFDDMKKLITISIPKGQRSLSTYFL